MVRFAVTWVGGTDPFRSLQATSSETESQHRL